MLWRIWIFTFALILTSTAQAHTCAEWLSQIKSSTEEIGRETSAKIRTYCREVKDTCGLRLILKPKENQPASRWLGFLELEPEPESLSRWDRVTKGPARWIGQSVLRQRGYQAAPLQGLYNAGVRLPIEWFSQHVFRKKLSPTLLTGILITSLYLLPIQDQIEQRLTATENKSIRQIEILLATDFRFHEILDAVKKGQLSPIQGMAAAFALKKHWEDYWSESRQLPTSKLLQMDLARAHEGHPLFAHLTEMFRNGVTKQNPGVFLRAPGPLSEAEKSHLVELTQKALLGMVRLNDSAQAWMGAVSSPQLRYRLAQEDLWNQLALAINDAIGAKFFFVDDQGIYREIGVADLRREMLAELDEGPPG